MTGRPIPARDASTEHADSPSGRSRERAVGVEANARLTATVGLVLVVMLLVEGLTILSIRQLLSWHVALGLALIPPVAVKIASTVWRFARYYQGDRRYRRAGPPHPLLRILGPVVTLSTLALLATGIAAAVEGPSAHLLLTAHQASFFIWFAAMAVHVMGHLPEAVRLARADITPLRRTRRVPHRQLRQATVVVALAGGIALAAVATATVAAPWQHRTDTSHRTGGPPTR